MNSTTITFSPSPALRIVRSAARILLPALVAALALSPRTAVAGAAPLDGVAHVVELGKNAPTPAVPNGLELAAPTKTTAQAPGSGLAAAMKPSSGNGVQVTDHRAAVLSRGAEQLQLAMLASLRGGTATRSALNRSDLPPVDLSGAASSDAGVSPGSGDLAFGAAGAPVQAGKSTGLAGIGGSTARAAVTGAGTMPKLRDLRVRAHRDHG